MAILRSTEIPRKNNARKLLKSPENFAPWQQRLYINLFEQNSKNKQTDLQSQLKTNILERLREGESVSKLLRQCEILLGAKSRRTSSQRKRSFEDIRQPLTRHESSKSRKRSLFIKIEDELKAQSSNSSVEIENSSSTTTIGSLKLLDEKESDKDDTVFNEMSRIKKLNYVDEDFTSPNRNTSHENGDIQSIFSFAAALNAVNSLYSTLQETRLCIV